MEFKKLNILYIATSITGGGGVARIVSQKTAAFVQAGHAVQLVSTNDQSDQPFYAFDSQVKLVLYPKVIRTLLQMERYYTFVQNEVIASFKPDVILVLDNGIKGYFASYFLGAKIPIYLEVHGSRNFLLTPIQSKGKRFFVDQVTRWLSKRFTGLLLLNEESKRDWQHRNLRVIPNWIDTSEHRRTCPQVASKQVLALGRLVPEKNYEAMLSVWKRMHAKQPQWELVICGTGAPDYVAYLKTLAGPGVLWKGEVTDVNLEIEKSAFLLHTSKMEGMPMAFLEAMVLGVPVVAFAVDFGPSTIIQHGQTGYLVPLGDEALMAHCCQLFMANQPLLEAFGARAKQAVQPYDKSVVLQQWATFFEGLG